MLRMRWIKVRFSQHSPDTMTLMCCSYVVVDFARLAGPLAYIQYQSLLGLQARTFVLLRSWFGSLRWAVSLEWRFVASCLYAPISIAPFSLVKPQSMLMSWSGRVYRSTWNSPSVGQISPRSLMCPVYRSVGKILTLNVVPHPAVFVLVVMHHLDDL